jgi:hypothetical protein
MVPAKGKLGDTFHVAAEMTQMWPPNMLADGGVGVNAGSG